jgi:hypothetical protein
MDTGTIVEIGDPSSGDELARAVFSDDKSAPILKRLKRGAQFRAECTVGLMSGGSYIPLEQCTLK